MTVKELIDFLSKEDPDMEVVVDGYEGDYCPIKPIYKKFVKENPNHKWYYGPYEISSDMEGKIVLVLPR